MNQNYSGSKPPVRRRHKSVWQRIRYDRIFMVLGIIFIIIILCKYLAGTLSKGSQKTDNEILARTTTVSTTSVQTAISNKEKLELLGNKADETTEASEAETTDTSVAESAEETTETKVSEKAKSDSKPSKKDLELRHKLYLKEMMVIGDSIASGFEAFEYIPSAHGFATGSVGIRSLHDYTHLCEGAEVDVNDAVSVIQPAYIYMSMGMNDVNMISAEEYHKLYKEEIEKILELSPQSNIVVAGITPIAAESDFTDPAKIVQYNEELQKMVKEFNKDNIKYFDTHALLADPGTGGLKPEYSSGDGIHQSRASYDVIIEALNKTFDDMPYPEELITTDISELEENTEAS